MKRYSYFIITFYCFVEKNSKISLLLWFYWRTLTNTRIRRISSIRHTLTMNNAQVMHDWSTNLDRVLLRKSKLKASSRNNGTTLFVLGHTESMCHFSVLDKNSVLPQRLRNVQFKFLQLNTFLILYQCSLVFVIVFVYVFDIIICNMYYFLKKILYFSFFFVN